MRSRKLAEVLTQINGALGERDVKDRVALFSELPRLLLQKPNAEALAVIEPILKALAQTDLSVAEFLNEVKPEERAVAAPTTIRQEYVQSLVREFEEALGHDVEFRTLHAAISAPRALNAHEAKALSRAFFGKPGSTKGDALANIMRRHTNLTAARREGRALGGKIAA